MFNQLMVLPNVLALVALSGTVVACVEAYAGKCGDGEPEDGEPGGLSPRGAARLTRATIRRIVLAGPAPGERTRGRAAFCHGAYTAARGL